jgi:hypothetical protein
VAPPGLVAHVAREWTRLRALRRDIRALETERAHFLAEPDAPADPTRRIVARLRALRGIGDVSAWLYAITSPREGRQYDSPASGRKLPRQADSLRLECSGERGGFPSDRFRVSTPAGDGAAPYVVLENVGPGRTAETLLEAPLPAAARDTPLRVRFERVRVALEVGPARTSRDVALPLWPGPMIITWGVQDADSAVVLQYSIPPELGERGAREGVSFEEARRSPASRYLRLRFEMRPRS